MQRHLVEANLHITKKFVSLNLFQYKWKLLYKQTVPTKSYNGLLSLFDKIN